MSTVFQLTQSAIMVADHYRDQRIDLETQLGEIEAKATELRAQIELLSACSERARTFIPDIDGYPQCPHCWVAHAVQSRLQAIDSAGEDEDTDVLRCRRCGRTERVAA